MACGEPRTERLKRREPADNLKPKRKRYRYPTTGKILARLAVTKFWTAFARNRAGLARKLTSRSNAYYY